MDNTSMSMVDEIVACLQERAGTRLVNALPVTMYDGSDRRRLTPWA